MLHYVIMRNLKYLPNHASKPLVALSPVVRHPSCGLETRNELPVLDRRLYSDNMTLKLIHSKFLIAVNTNEVLAYLQGSYIASWIQSHC